MPGIRPLAEELVINPNTVVKAYRELEHEGVIELSNGSGAFVSGNARAKKCRGRHPGAYARGLTEEEIRRLFEAELGAGPMIIETVDLRKNYNGVDALRGLNLKVPAGSILWIPGTKWRRQNYYHQGPARHGPAGQRPRQRIRACGIWFPQNKVL